MADEYTDIGLAGNDDDGWTLEYRDLNGNRQRMVLDAETYADATFEAAGLLEMDEAEFKRQLSL